jgi:small-conductance mechanosensitive channel
LTRAAPRLFPALILLFLLAPRIWAAPLMPQPYPLQALTKTWSAALAKADKLLAAPNAADDALNALRTELSALRLEARTEIDKAQPDIDEIRGELQTLGTPPDESEAAESPEVANKRKLVGEQLAALEGAVKEAEFAIAHAERLLTEVNELRRKRFTQKLLERGRTPLHPDIWRKAAPEFLDAVAWARLEFLEWLESEAFARQREELAGRLALGLAAAFVLAWPLRHWLPRRFGIVAVEGEAPTHGQRLRVALFNGFMQVLTPSAATLAAYLAVAQGDLLGDAGRALAWTILTALIFLYCVSAFCRSGLAPYAPEWRVVRVNDYAARSVSLVVTALACVFALDQALDEWLIHFDASLELTVEHQFLSSLLIAALLLLSLRGKIWRDPASVRSSWDEGARAWRPLRLFLAALVGAIPLSGALGYVALSRILATQFVLTAGLFVVVVLLRQLAAEFVEHALAPAKPEGAEESGEEDSGASMRFWLAELAGALVVLLGVLALLMLWGAGEDDISAWLYTAFFGFKVGTFTLSLADVGMAALLFAGVLTLTRFLQRTLEQRIFPRTRLDIGVRHSIRSAIGYLGFMLGGALSVSTLGIDLSSLAIIAGALSVGIGFGLQNIVNNFVSGLILLIERPIKAGDWVVVGEHQGHVKKISVRATEILTLDHASVFIPNSNLISSPVMNRTYADTIGRVSLPVGIAYGSNAGRAREILLAIARRHPEVRFTPTPEVHFKGFGDNSLNLELVAFINDVDKVRAVGSDLFFEIEASFAREGIAFPFPQRDVHLDLREEQLERLARALEKLGRGGVD